MDFDFAESTKLVDYGAVGNFDRAVDGIDFVAPFARTERYAANHFASLAKFQRQVTIAAAHLASRFIQFDFPSKQYGARVGLAERCHRFDLFDDV